MSRRTAIQTATGAGAALAIGKLLAASPSKAAARPSAPRTRPGAKDGAYFPDLWRQRKETLSKAAAASDACDEAEYAAKKAFPAPPIYKGPEPRLGIGADLDRIWREQQASIRKELAHHRRTCRAILREHGVAHLEAKARALWNHLDVLDCKIADTPAADAVGVRVKMKIIEEHEVMILHSEKDGKLKIPLRAFDSALVDLDYIAGPMFLGGMKNGNGAQLS